MSNKSINQYKLLKIKKLAKRIAKVKGIPLSQAQEEIAKELGFSSWFQCRNQVLKGANIDEISEPEKNEKVYSHEFDPEKHTVDDVRGMNFDTQKNEYIASIRHSFLNYIGDDFESVNGFRDRLEHDIRNIIRNSKSHTEIHIELYADSSILSRIKSTEHFFDSILNRFIRVSTLHVVQRDTPIGLDEMESILKGAV